MIRFVALIALLAIPGCPDRGVGTGSLRQQVRDARFIFKGTILKTNATTMASIPASDSTVVVRIDEILESPLPDNLTGLSITVVLEKPNSVKLNDQLIFFTRGLVYGQSIAVQEVGRRDVKADATGLRQQIDDALQRNADQDLQKLIQRATLVIVGKVVRIEEVPEKNRIFSISEHN